MENTFTLNSPAFQNNSLIPSLYTCDGKNINPPLEINNLPKTAKSWALIVNDPDAPVGTWTHWTIWNIEPTVTQISENSSPANAIQGITSFGKPGYGGPCPPSGTHRYFFKAFALDQKIDLPTSSTADNLTQAIKDHIVAQTELIGLYNRSV